MPGSSGWLVTPRGEAGPLGAQPLPRLLERPPPKPPIPPPLAIQAGHLGSEIRSMLYFRVRHTGWKQMVEQEAGALTQDMWCDLEGVHGHLGGG